MAAVLATLTALLPGVPPRAAPAQMSATLKRVVVVGGGWAGYTVADALSASPDVHVTLLEARPSTGGLAGGWRTPGGRPVEAGVHGFWREYRNTFATMRSVGIDVEDVLTPFTPSVLVSKAGKVATAPVLGSDPSSPPNSRPNPAARSLPFSPQALLASFAALLPPPLDTALLAEFAPNSRLTAADRVSAIGLLPAWADFGQEERESWMRYDDLTAEELFKRYGGVSTRTYEDLVEPLLHVLPMGPGADISAAAALSCFHVFALQARGAFDVRWCRGSISDRVFTPWLAKLEARPNFTLRAGAKVASIAQATQGTAAGAQGESTAENASKNTGGEVGTSGEVDRAGGGGGVTGGVATAAEVTGAARAAAAAGATGLAGAAGAAKTAMAAEAMAAAERVRMAKWAGDRTDGGGGRSGGAAAAAQATGLAQAAAAAGATGMAGAGGAAKAAMAAEAMGAAERVRMVKATGADDAAKAAVAGGITTSPQGAAVAAVSPLKDIPSPPASGSGASAQTRGSPPSSAKPRLEVRLAGSDNLNIADDNLFLADAVVLAVGATAAARLRASSPLLQAQLSTSGFDRLRGITCVAVRLYLTPASYRTAGLGGGAFDSTLLPPNAASAMVASPVLVAGPAIGGLPELRETGFCVYDLQRLHPELAEGDLAVMEVDFYRADSVAQLTDDAVTTLALRAASAALGLPASALPPSLLVDAAVVRARRAVSHFDPGSAKLSPPVTIGGGVYACGDWIDRCGHASWSTEKSVVTAKQAAAAIARDLRLCSVDAPVIPAAPDTPQLQALRRLARSARAAGVADAAGLPVPAPWASLFNQS